MYINMDIYIIKTFRDISINLILIVKINQSYLKLDGIIKDEG